jgi:hypothetical protein
MGMIAARFTHVLQRGADSLCMHLLLIFQWVAQISKTCNRLNMTLTIFDWVELAGHLPLYGVMGVLLIWTPTEEDQRLWLRGVLGSDQGVSREPPSRGSTEPGAAPDRGQ